MASNEGNASPVKVKRVNGVDRCGRCDVVLKYDYDYDDKWKIFNDSVHGHIEVNMACLAIIDTPQFQRLRFIKQLGFCYYVYPGASHNRFEHSIGVYHLAGKMVRSLRSRQPELGITKEDILCVEIAGLCHDLGHGPHSHMFDGKFIPQVKQNMDWKHEEASLKMFDYLIAEHGFMEPGGVFAKHDLYEDDIVFIKELINGPLKKTKDDWPYRGRKEEKAFLYEIVSNKRTGIDVDKWDYFARDCHHLGCVNNFDHNRFIKFVRVLNVNGRPQICSRDKEIHNLYQMFYTRYILHRTAYQHKVACACEYMAVDALLKANDFLNIKCRDGSTVNLSNSVKDMSAYMYVTDNILWEIYTSQDPKLDQAKDIIKRLFCRDLYQCVGERSVSKTLQKELQKKENVKNMVPLMNKLNDQLIQLSASIEYRPQEDPKFKLNGSHFRLQIVFMDFGKKDKNPLKEMRYYSKAEPNTPQTQNDEMGGLLVPPQFTDNLIRIYSIENRTGVCDFLKKCFDKLCLEWGIEQRPTSMAWEEEVMRTPEKKPVQYEPEFSAGHGRASMSQDH